ncbi:hypothetical protein NDU88_004550 [Pleurodeles waltl]|uniref:Uncharacterized protein n=1 Tax=Pleurodeles waltl TaxID=8319 RepID=A0AAV7NMZ8_PLEWA|nr:hypothetical protein NDU88_004550 [Pleurodeles waltl]
MRSCASWGSLVRAWSLILKTDLASVRSAQDHLERQQGTGFAAALPSFDPSQNLYDTQFGDGGVGDREMHGTSADCGVFSGVNEWNLDYEEREVEEGETVEEQECEWWVGFPGNYYGEGRY